MPYRDHVAPGPAVSLMTIEDAAHELGLDEQVVEAAVAAGRIATVALGDPQ
jgi:hypothetical protein